MWYHFAMKCNLCPRNCNVDRTTKLGFCNSPSLANIYRVGTHHWEEPCISGTKGSGTIFFGGCNLRCRFCQNYQISRNGNGVLMDENQLADLFLRVADSGVHNVNLVTPQHYSDIIARALSKVKHKLSVPVVYNTNSYESVGALANLDGLVDVYLPDIKFVDATLSANLCGAANYFEVASKALGEMLRQQPQNVFDNIGAFAPSKSTELTSDNFILFQRAPARPAEWELRQILPKQTKRILVLFMFLSYL